MSGKLDSEGMRKALDVQLGNIDALALTPVLSNLSLGKRRLP
jgi:hypothetical protein